MPEKSSLTQKELDALCSAIHIATASELELIDCHMRHGKAMKGAAPAIRQSRRLIRQWNRIIQKLREAVRA